MSEVRACSHVAATIALASAFAVLDPSASAQLRRFVLTRTVSSDTAMPSTCSICSNVSPSRSRSGADTDGTKPMRRVASR